MLFETVQEVQVCPALGLAWQELRKAGTSRAESALSSHKDWPDTHSHGDQAQNSYLYQRASKGASESVLVHTKCASGAETSDMGPMRKLMEEGVMTAKDSMVGSVPIYVSLQKDLLGLIRDGSVEPGGRFPSERELSVRFGASRMTTRKAVDHLVQSGVLERRGTSGTYVPDRLFDRPFSEHTFYSVSDVVEKAGHEPGSKLLFFERKEADEFMASKLGLAPGDAVISLERLRTVNGVPVCLELSHFPAALVPGLSAADVTENTSLYRFFRENYQLELMNDVRVISIHYASKIEGDLLEIRTGAPVLHFEGVSRTSDGRPFEHLRSLNHPDRVSLTINPPTEKQGSNHGNPIGWMLQK